MRLLICAGGTGGGVYPALAVLKALSEGEGMPVGIAGEPGLYSSTDSDSASDSVSHPTVLWIGGIGGMETDLVKRENVPFEAIPAAGIHGVGMRQLPRNLWQISRGTLAAWRILRRVKPHVMFFTGGYLAVPVALAGRLPGISRRRPANLLYVPDIEPGLALKTLARFADRIAVTSEESMDYLPRNPSVKITGYPVRTDLASWIPQQSREVFGLEPGRFTLLVLGGSKGARSINRALSAILPELLDEIQIVHLTGHLDWEEVEEARTNLEKHLATRYHVFPYLYTEMGAALRAADLVVSRAGASVLGEYPLVGLPAILVPYPYAWRYQEVNARYLEQHGAAVILQDADLQAALLGTIREIVHDPGKRTAMSQAMRSLAHPEAARAIAGQIVDLANAWGAGRSS